CMLKHNQTRMQQKPYCREERFLSTEKSTLGELPDERFELKYYAELKVGNNGHVYLQRSKHYYSVPFTYIGTKVKVIYTRSMLSIYCKGKQIATHIRSYRENAYTTIEGHLKSEHQAYKSRSHQMEFQLLNPLNNSFSVLISPFLHSYQNIIYTVTIFGQFILYSYRFCIANFSTHQSIHFQFLQFFRQNTRD